MADIKLTAGGYTFTFAESEVKKISTDIDSNVEVQPMPGYGAAIAYGFDYEGVTKTITISGILFATATTRVTGYTIDTILKQKQWLESLVSGNQGTIIFTSNYEGASTRYDYDATPPYLSSFAATTVKIKTMNFTEIEALTEELSFSITMEVCQ